MIVHSHVVDMICMISQLIGAFESHALLYATSCMEWGT